MTEPTIEQRAFCRTLARTSAQLGRPPTFREMATRAGVCLGSLSKQVHYMRKKGLLDDGALTLTLAGAEAAR